MPDRVTFQLTRGTILAAAMKLFSRQGIAATPVEDLLEAAGISRRTFYKYFHSKEDVLAALYAVANDELVRTIAEARDRAGDAPLAGIHAGIDRYLDFHRDGARGLRELLELALRAESLLAPDRRRMRDLLVTMLDDAVHRLDGRRLDPLLYHALISALEGLSLQLLDDGARPAELERARAVIHALVDQALGVPGGRPLPRLTGGRR